MNVYDFDNTIYDGDSSVDFYLFVLFRKPYLFIFLPFQIWSMVLFLTGIYSKERMKESFFIFLRYISVYEMVSKFWKIKNKKIKSWYLQQKMDSDLIISASPEFLLEQMVCGYLGVKLIASLIDINTCKFIGNNCYGNEKIVRIFKKYPDCVIEKFYSDSLSDTPLAHIAKKAFLIQKNVITEWK